MTIKTIRSSVAAAGIGTAIALLVGGAVGCGDDEWKGELTISGPHAVGIGETAQLAAATTTLKDTGYSWSSDDVAVATVDETGLVTGIAPGEASITATGKNSHLVGTHAVVVTVSGEVGIVVSGNPFVQIGATTTLSASTIGSVDSSYTWKSADEGIATVDADGVVTGVSNGEVTITATGQTSGKSGSISIEVALDIPQIAEWQRSGHARRSAEAFRHWDEEDPAEIPTSCAKCHSSPGFRDFIGADGSAVGTVDKAAPVGSVIECATCHNSAASALSSVTFPSGVAIHDLGPEAICMTCHQGRASNDDVDQAIATAAQLDLSGLPDATDPEARRAALRQLIDGQVDPDVVPAPASASDALGFLNIHYYAAGATLEAGRVRGGFQYSGKAYDWRFRHVPGADTCVGCHNQHSLELRISTCASCHVGVAKKEDLRNIRMMSSATTDYDNDGDLIEGIYYELQGLREKLLAAIQAYPTAVDPALTKICYDANTYPYFFKDTNGDAACDASEAAFSNGYKEWTPRLLRAAYNYQVATKDPGAFAHNAKYIMQLLHDSIVDLNTVVNDAQFALPDSGRNDPGHFNGAGEAARHWDADETVSAACTQCHGGSDGFKFFLEYGIVTPKGVEQDNGLDCATCHTSFEPDWNVRAVASVVYPGATSGVSAKTVTGDPDTTSNMCSTCHSGRESGATIDTYIAGTKGNDARLAFRNVHYLPAGAMRLGSLAALGYQYPGKQYSGADSHASGVGDACIFCHDPVATKHTFAIQDNLNKCQVCHGGVDTLAKLEAVRNDAHTGKDYDGDGNSTEPLHDELAGLAAKLLATMWDSATVKICYSPDAYPYFFVDTNGDKTCNPDETVSSNQYGYSSSAHPVGNFTPALLRAAHNYQIFVKEPGAWAHNFDYMAQLLYDGIVDLGGDTTGLVRPLPPTP